MVISTVTFIVSTAEELQKDKEGRVDFPRIVLIIDLIDNFVVIFFTVEFLTRLIVCPNKKRYWQYMELEVDSAPDGPFI